MSEFDPDSALVERVGRGDATAVRRLVAAKLPRILALATRILRDRVEAEDVTQEAFIRVWRHASRWVPGRARFDTWLHTVVLNLCRDRLRSRRELLGDEAVADVSDPTPDAEASLLEGEKGEAVAEAIAALPGRQREAILLVHYQDFSGMDAAAAMGISLDALESLLARGRRTLQARLARRRELDDDA